MLLSIPLIRKLLLASTVTSACVVGGAFPVDAQSPEDRDALTTIIDGRRSDQATVRRKPLDEAPMNVGGAAQKAEPAAKSMQKLVGVWVEGPGFEINYGGTYERCAERCLAHQKCLMIEYYRPEKKCNLYDTVRPRLKGGSSIVGIKN